jgi:hypothetical protein
MGNEAFWLRHVGLPFKAVLVVGFTTTICPFNVGLPCTFAAEKVVLVADACL